MRHADPRTAAQSVTVTDMPTIADILARERLRNRIEAAVARLIDALDAIDGDPEAEPSLGAPEQTRGRTLPG